MAYLGIDQSLNGTGLCVLSSTGFANRLCTLKQRTQDGDRRLANIRAAIAELLSGIDGAAIEGYSFDSTHRAFDLGEVAGVVKCLLVEREVPFVVVPPATLKKFATGVASASKAEMLATARLTVVVDDDNQADALFLARVARAIDHGHASRCELEALRSLRDTSPRRRPRRARCLVPNAI